MDTLRCTGLTYSCSVGIHSCEKDVRQDLVIDFSARVDAIPREQTDDPRAIRLDYYRADQILQEHLTTRRFNLIETVAEEVARLLLENFAIASVQVRVTKKPLDMSRLGSVSYECERVKNS